jgi:hypothetical protein
MLLAEEMTEANKNSFAKFCNETSLPGWAYLNRDIPKIWKALWAAFLMAILIISVCLFYQNASQVRSKFEVEQRLMFQLFIAL